MENAADYKYLVTRFSEKQIFGRLFFWTRIIRSVIKAFNLEKFTRIDNDRLVFMILCYFSDIDRLKEFHKIEKVHKVKVFAYSFYWFLKIMPIQITQDFPKEKETLISINEIVVLYVWLYGFLAHLPIDISLKRRYANELQYFIKYRLYTAQTIEAMLVALHIGAGQDPFYSDKNPVP